MCILQMGEYLKCHLSVVSWRKNVQLQLACAERNPALSFVQLRLKNLLITVCAYWHTASEPGLFRELPAPSPAAITLWFFKPWITQRVSFLHRLSWYFNRKQTCPPLRRGHKDKCLQWCFPQTSLKFHLCVELYLKIKKVIPFCMFHMG